jgi:aminopeptidase
MELLGTLSEIELHEIENANAYVAIVAPDNTRDEADIPAERLATRQATLREPHMPYLSDEKPWVGCYFPTTGAAQDAGLPLPAFEDFLYSAVLIDWEWLREDAADRRALRPRRDRPDRRAGDRHHLQPRRPQGHRRRAPREHARRGDLLLAARGLRRRSDHLLGVPGLLPRPRVERVQLRFGAAGSSTRRQRGTRSSCSALETDDGARRLGEFGIGCNGHPAPHAEHLFDEKMEGTIHLAIGTGLPQVGG